MARLLRLALGVLAALVAGYWAIYALLVVGTTLVEGGPSACWPTGLALAPDGGLFIADQWANGIRRIDPAGKMTMVAQEQEAERYHWLPGPPRSTPGPHLSSPFDVAIGPDGSLYTACRCEHTVFRIEPSGDLSVVAGTGEEGFAGDGGLAADALLSKPQGVAVGRDGSVYVADSGNARVRKIAPSGIISTYAGAGGEGYHGDGGPATRAKLFWPWGLSMGADGALYIADLRNHVVRKVDPSGIITTVAGTGHPGYAGDGGPASKAKLHYPVNLHVCPDGTLYIAEGKRVRKVDSADVITTVAGRGGERFSGDGGPAIDASLDGVCDIAAAPDGTMYIADTFNRRIRRVDPDGIIATIAGPQRFTGNWGPVKHAKRD